MLSSSVLGCSPRQKTFWLCWSPYAFGLHLVGTQDFSKTKSSSNVCVCPAALHTRGGGSEKGVDLQRVL